MTLTIESCVIELRLINFICITEKLHQIKNISEVNDREIEKRKR